ncbi:hypothetical protein Barb4_00371 [Bacteroidales bacterium Barb4]|nr:hypothetical protein Barb4_00371 [Bacteroidales bacterium Barb4]
MRNRPEGTGDFSPTCSKAECGVMDDTIRKVLKERPDIICYILSFAFVSFFQNLLVTRSINPTFRFAACGAEISCPFGTSCKP